MDTIINTYLNHLAKIIGCNPSDLSLWQEYPTDRKTGKGFRVETLNYLKDGVDVQGKFSIKHQTKSVIEPVKKVASFELYKFPHCCAFMISCNSFVNFAYQNKGIGKLLNQFRIDIARELGFTALVCTDRDKNEIQRKLLKKNGWKDIYTVKNKRTNNVVHISIIET